MGFGNVIIYRVSTAGIVEKPARGQPVATEEQSVFGTGLDRLDADTAAYRRGENQSDERFERWQPVQSAADAVR